MFQPQSGVCCGGECLAEVLVLGLMGGLKAWLRSLPLSLSLSALTPPAVLLLCIVCVCLEVSEGRGDEKSLPALCIGNPDKPKHNTTHCSFVICNSTCVCVSER